MDKPIVNRVAKSPIVTVKLEDYLPQHGIVAFDLKPYLFKGLILREKDFRTALKEMDWSNFQDQNVAIMCSADAIVPVWAYMLIGIYLSPVANRYAFCSESELRNLIVRENLATLDTEALKDKPVVIKGCGDTPIPEAAYVEVTRLLQPIVKTLMYGEPCSMVPLYKKRKPRV